VDVLGCHDKVEAEAVGQDGRVGRRTKRLAQWIGKNAGLHRQTGEDGHGVIWVGYFENGSADTDWKLEAELGSASKKLVGDYEGVSELHNAEDDVGTKAGRTSP